MTARCSQCGYYVGHTVNCPNSSVTVTYSDGAVMTDGPHDSCMRQIEHLKKRVEDLETSDLAARQTAGDWRRQAESWQARATIAEARVAELERRVEVIAYDQLEARVKDLTALLRDWLNHNGTCVHDLVVRTSRVIQTEL